MFAQLPKPPPLPVGDAASLGIALAAVAAGVALLLWGRLAGRIAFLAAGGWAGWWLGTILADGRHVSPLPAQILTAVASAMLAFLLAPLLWGVLAGALAGGTALYFAVVHYLAMASRKPPPLRLAGLDLPGYALALVDHAWRCTKDVWNDNAAALGIIVGLAGGVPLLIGAIRLRLATVVMSSLTGGAAIVTGLAVGAGVLFPEVAQALWDHWFLLAGAAAATAVVGIGVQYRRVLKADRDQKNREGEPPRDKTPVLD